ncbi:hypothetical protein NT6N_34100 [Oceaniferula spumae]|uniref:Tetratricopeptide repeat protein n=1 Tax=Oceaniferula spumae TaxID=2979115 RepID=A0AAT9FQS9_9BACT
MLCAQENANIYAEAALTSHDILPGEQVSLIVRVRGGQPDSRPTPPEIEGVAVNYVRSVTQVDENRQLSHAFLYRLTPVSAGDYTVPAFEISSQGKALKTEPQQFRVHAVDQLISLASGIRAAWFPAKTTLYQGEQCEVILKLYIPESTRIVNWGYPDAKKVNCLAWRFAPPPDHNYSQVQIGGVTHRSVTYSTNLSGISPGKAMLGPSELTLHERRSVIDPAIGSRISDVPLNLVLPALEFDILALPEGAPADFNGAIGNFQIDARCEKTTLQENDPTEVILRVAGTGNLETLKPPAFSDDSWKIIDTSKITRGEERRYISGMVTFRQLIRAESSGSLPTSIPAYSFSYFNPDTRSYATLKTTPIPVSITPAVKSLQPAAESADTAPEEMRNILGFIDRSNISDRTSSSQWFSRWGWHLIPIVICLLIITPILRRKIAAARVKHPDTERKEAALKKIGEDTDIRTFYRRAGRFIEQWLTLNPDLETILKERDALCFQPETGKKTPMPSDRKAEILGLLKRCSKLTLSIAIVLLGLSAGFISNVKADQVTSEKAAITAWKSGQYQQAIDHYKAAYPDPSAAPADVLFNIGNCHHRIDQPGAAALAWRQALAVEPTHRDARQNLRFVEIEKNARVPEYEDWQVLLVYFSPRVYQITFYIGLWLLGLSILVLFLRHPGGITLTLCIIALVLSPIIATLGKVAVHNYPDDHRFAPLKQQAVVMTGAKLYSEAHRQTKNSQSLTAASLVKINATRGPWTHISTVDEFEGWVESKFLGKVR